MVFIKKTELKKGKLIVIQENKMLLQERELKND